MENPMTQNSLTAVEFLRTRRSRPAKTLAAPAPDKAELRDILEMGARVPDHGKLEPWRFIVISSEAMSKLAETAEETAKRLGYPPEKVAKARQQFDQGISAIAVIEAPVLSEKIPALEQTYSAGAVCLGILNAALALGWGANWLSGAISHEPEFARNALGLAPRERIAGLIHIGTETARPPERPRPDLDEKTTWL